MKPLVTIGVKCFNQEKYIGEALEAAFAQTYRPLEIVASDDASADGSWEIIRDVANRHAGMEGVSVVLNRNPRNLGNLGNWMKIGALSHGGWIVKADGDDVSRPDRVARIAAEIARSGGGRHVVLHGAVKIDPEGKTIGGMKVRYASHPLGAVMAFSKECFTKFPAPADGRLVDDEIFARRALMLGGEINIPEPLVKYRVGTGISSGMYDIREPELRCVRQLPQSIAQSLIDLESRRSAIGDDAYVHWRRRLESELENARKYADLIGGADFATRFKAWRGMPRPGIFTPSYLKMLAYLLPRRTGDRLLALLGKVRYG